MNLNLFPVTENHVVQLLIFIENSRDYENVIELFFLFKNRFCWNLVSVGKIDRETNCLVFSDLGFSC